MKLNSQKHKFFQADSLANPLVSCKLCLLQRPCNFLGLRVRDDHLIAPTTPLMTKSGQQVLSILEKDIRPHFWTGRSDSREILSPAPEN